MSRALDDLSSAMKPKAFELLARLTEHGIMVLVVDTLRTPEEHAQNLKNGTSWATRSKHLPRHLRGTLSADDPNRDKSDAIDIAPYEVYALHGPDKLRWDAGDPIWNVIGKIGESLNLRWGGRFKPPAKPDLGHFEVK